MDNDELTGLVFTDFRKAFDVFDLELLLSCLSKGFFPLPSLGLNRTCLRESTFLTLGKVKSEQLTVKQGVPQGSILGGAFPFVRQRYASSCSQINYGDLCR